MQRVGLVVVGGAALLLIYRTLRKRLDAAESELATVSKAKDALAALARAQLDEKELLPDRGETAETYWRKLKGEAPTAEETELFDRLVAAFKAMNPCHCPSKSA